MWGLQYQAFYLKIQICEKYSVIFLVAELNAFFQSLCLILFAECLDFFGAKWRIVSLHNLLQEFSRNSEN